jgi:hypothetical protein
MKYRKAVAETLQKAFTSLLCDEKHNGTLPGARERPVQHAERPGVRHMRATLSYL